MKNRTRGFAAIAIAAALAIATAIPAAAWTYRTIGYPGAGKTVSTTTSEGSCVALAYSRGFNGGTGLVQTVKTSGGSNCSVSIQYGLWNGSGVWWGPVDTDPRVAAYTPGSSWYISRHGVDS